MHAFRRIASLVAAVVVLGTPGAALAQTPGDEQYTDPFGGEQEQEQEQAPTPTPTETPVPTPPPDTSSAPEPSTAPATSQTPAAVTAQTTASSAQLPRTGADAGLIALGGALLLAGGVALRVRVRD